MSLDRPSDVVSVGPTSGLQYVRMTPSMCKAMEALMFLTKKWNVTTE